MSEKKKKENTKESIDSLNDNKHIGNLVPDLKIKLESETARRETNRIVQLMFEGNSVDKSLVNSIRRTMLREIPIYAISRSSTTIQKNTTAGVFDDDHMRQKLSMLHFKGKKSNVKLLHPVYYPYVCGTQGLINPINYDQKKDPKDTSDIKIVIHAHNKTSEDYIVTTNDLSMFIDDEIQENPFDKKFPIELLMLRPGQEFKSSSNLVLGIGKLHSCWDCLANARHQKLNDNKYILIMESINFDRQLNEYDIATKACKILLIQFDAVKDSILKLLDEINKENNSDSKGKKKRHSLKTIIEGALQLKIDNAEESIGGILESTFNRHKKVKIATFTKSHPEDKHIILRVKLVQDSNINTYQKVIESCFKYIDEIYKLAIKQLKELKKSSKYNGDDSTVESPNDVLDKYAKLFSSKK